MMLSNVNISALLALCEGNPPVTGGFPSQSPVMRSFDVFFDMCRNKRLSKQSRRRWYETPSRSLWRHCNAARLNFSYQNSSDEYLVLPVFLPKKINNSIWKQGSDNNSPFVVFEEKVKTDSKRKHVKQLSNNTLLLSRFVIRKQQIMVSHIQ